MIERIRELSNNEIDRLAALGHDVLSAISPPIASMVYSDNPDQFQALQKIGPDALGTMSPQLADMLYGNDGNSMMPGKQPFPYPWPEKSKKKRPFPIILPPFPIPPGGGGDDGGGGYQPDPGDPVVWWAFGDACPTCLDNAADDPRPYGEPFSSGDTEPPAHDHCRCHLESSIRGSSTIFPAPGRRVFELSSRY